MAKKERPEASNGEAGGSYDPHTHARAHQSPPPPPPPPMNPQTGIMPAADVPQLHPPGFSAAPGRYMTANARVGWQAPGYPPPPAGSTAQSAHNLMPPLPIGTKATHFSGPLVSGGIPQVSEWSAPHGGLMLNDPIGGTPILTTYLALDYSQGNFSVPVQFPEDSLIISYAAVTAIPFTASPTFQLGTLSGASDIVSGGAFPAAGSPVTFTATTGQLPLWDPPGLQQSFQAFLTVNGNTSGTAGLGFILFQFVRIPQRWT